MKLWEIPLEGYETILLDRDGTVNVHIVDGYVRSWEEFRFIPGALEALRLFHRQGRQVFIVTNQRGVGRRCMSEEDLQEIHARMCAEVAARGGMVSGIYCCTAVSETDPDRKPNTGMFERLLAEHPEVRRERTLMVGDGEVDMEFARNCDIDGVRVDSVKERGGREYTVKNDERVCRKK